MMATFLNKLGLIAWFSASIERGIANLGLGWPGAAALLLLAYLYAHYLFASTTAHITAMFAAFYGAGIALGAPALPFFLADGRRLQHHDDPDPLRHGHLAGDLRLGLHDAGRMVGGGFRDEPGADRGLAGRGRYLVEAAGILVSQRARRARPRTRTLHEGLAGALFDPICARCGND
jgi:hypothetical protein